MVITVLKLNSDVRRWKKQGEKEWERNTNIYLIKVKWMIKDKDTMYISQLLRTIENKTDT